MCSKSHHSDAHSDLTQLLERWRAGDTDAESRLMPLIYDELRRLAGSSLGHGEAGTVDATEVVHEAYLRLVGSEAEWPSRAHFYAFSARLMRNILVDFARQRQSQKRGGELLRVTLDRLINSVPAELATDRLLALDEALERLAEVAPRPARVVELHYFGGLDYEATAEILEVSKTTVNRDLRVAKAWLRKELKKMGEARLEAPK